MPPACCSVWYMTNDLPLYYTLTSWVNFVIMVSFWKDTSEAFSTLIEVQKFNNILCSSFVTILFEFSRQNYQLFIDVRFACIFTKLDILQDFHLLCFSRNRRRPSRKVQHKRPLPAKMKALLCMCAWWPCVSLYRLFMDCLIKAICHSKFSSL